MNARGKIATRPNPPSQAKEGDERVDWAKVRADFPILARKVHGMPLIYLDSANTSQKPRQV
ncbi:MAG: hypothetical protein ACREP2_00570, partial [Rhodanobacteraceae bacterium]